MIVRHRGKANWVIISLAMFGFVLLCGCSGESTSSGDSSTVGSSGGPPPPPSGNGPANQNIKPNTNQSGQYRPATGGSETDQAEWQPSDASGDPPYPGASRGGGASSSSPYGRNAGNQPSSGDAQSNQEQVASSDSGLSVSSPYGKDARVGEAPKGPQMREWTDTSGSYKIMAEFVKFQGGKVHLKKEDGEVIEVKPTMLCDEDRQYYLDLLRKKRGR